MTDVYQGRLQRLRQIEGVDAVALVPGANLVYFTGLHMLLSERPTIALITADGFSMIVPKLETLNLDLRPDLAAQGFVWSDSEGYDGAFKAAIATLGLNGKTLGIDGMTMRATEMLTLQSFAPSLNIRPVERALIGIRARKQPDEIAAMRKAVTIAEDALAAVMAEVRPGMTEKQVAAQIIQQMSDRGGEKEAFSTLVQFGENSANPHSHPSERQLAEGEFLLIDFGCFVDGYPSDITRTFCLGQPTAEMQKIYDTVLRANEAGKAAAKPGIPMGAVDKAARDVIEAAGYGPYFTHRTGHGLGMEIHEPIPQIAAGVADLLEPGMSFTIEPGIYIPGMGGVRIEDNVVITETGLEVLTQYPRRLTL